MIRMIQSTSAGHAKAYFSDALSKSDYYLGDQELAGRLRGKLAERLGLGERVDKETFFALCENRDPITGDPLIPITRGDRRVGYDINFHAPKSASIVHALSKDGHIMDAFEASVTETMREIEKDVQTRVRTKGENFDRDAGELVWAEFTHQTARPVDGAPPDPHLHSHCFTFNATWDKEEERNKAGQFGNIKRDMPYYQALFQKKFSDKLIELGYTIKNTRQSFEIVGIPKAVIEQFSKRTNEIGQYAQEKGITGAKALSEIGAKTRAKKQAGMPMSELKNIWRQQIGRLENISGSEKEQPVRVPPKPMQPQSGKRCVDYALQHSFERASVMGERRLLEQAFRYGIGDGAISSDAIAKAFKEDQRIIRITEHGRVSCTTHQVLKEEQEMVRLAKARRGTMPRLYEIPPDTRLPDQQHAAVKHVLTTTNRVAIIRGAAGAGKMTLMRYAIALIEKKGKEVTVLAPSTQSSRGVLRDEGFKEANTVARFLIDDDMQENVKNQVLWIDEAGLLGTQDMKKLLEIATKKNARLILGGDTRQHSSVIRGDALRILNTVAGIKAAEVDKIYRQKNFEYKAAVKSLSEGKILDAFHKLNEMGAIAEVDPSDPYKGILKDYMTAVQANKSVLVISPTHKQGEIVTTEIRAALRQAGRLGKKEIVVPKYNNLNLTQAQKGDVSNFKEGQFVQFNQNLKGIKRGSLWSVDEIKDKTIKIKSDKGRSKSLPMDQAKDFDVLEKTTLALSKGDMVMINRPVFDKDKKRLENGTILKVESVSKKGAIILRNNKSKNTFRVPQDFGHLSHAHAITSYAAQSKTVDMVLIVQPSATFPATDLKQFYVSVSRGRDAGLIYTDDKKALLEHASQLGNRESAMEMVERGKTHFQYLMEINRDQITKAYSPKKSMDKEYEPEF
jgi:conjugative relaxase-like TrwC/TraI family protein